MYIHSKYDNFKSEGEIYRLSEEIKHLQRCNTEKMIQLTEIEEPKTNNMNIIQKLKETKVKHAI